MLSTPIARILKIFLLWLSMGQVWTPGILSKAVSVERFTTAESWPVLALEKTTEGLNFPVHITHSGDSSDRLFVVEQPGKIRIVRNGVLESVPFLDITQRVRSGGEEGLLSVAFPPAYAGKGYFYVYYTNKAGDNLVSRFHLLPGKPDQADPDSEDPILYLDHPTYGNHNGGQLAFGVHDPFLYIGTGDGGGSGDPQDHAQDLDSLLGKLLRIDVEGNISPYSIPATNPLTQTTGARGEIWALGLRNPWRFAFDSLTGDLYIGDVGQGRYEEINYQPASSLGGENYGWNIMEGSQCFADPNCDPSGLVLPVAEYQRLPGSCASVTGGHIYRGSTFSRMVGVYFYADACDGRIWGLRKLPFDWDNSLLLETSFRYGVVTFGEDESGEIYLADLNKGVVYRLVDFSQTTPGAIFLPFVTRSPD